MASDQDEAPVVHHKTRQDKTITRQDNTTQHKTTQDNTRQAGMAGET